MTWSLDARVLIRPARTYQALAAKTVADPPGTFWLAARRPLFLTFVIACVISLLGTSVATIRLIGATTIYWSYVALVEALALIIVLQRRPGGRAVPALIDTFFAGHAAWTVLLLLIGAVLPVTSPMNWWSIIVGPAVAGILLAVAWSAYVDVCFFRFVCGSPVRRAIGQVALNRFITWTLVFWIFAVPEPTPFGVFQEIADAVKEILT